MPHRFRSLALALSTTLLACTGPTLAEVAVGQAAPDFRLKDLDGNEVALADLQGKVVVLEWANPNCPFWKRNADQKTMVTTFRAPASTETGAAAAIGGRSAAPPSVTPHSPQKLSPGSFGVPQAGHGAARRAPQPPQNLRPGRFSWPHAAQRIPSAMQSRSVPQPVPREIAPARRRDATRGASRPSRRTPSGSL